MFAYLWAAANVVHVASLRGWRWDHPLGWAYVATTAAVMLRPGSLRLFAAMLAVDLAGTACFSPRYPNHILLSAIVNAALLAAILPRLARGTPEDEIKSAALRDYGPAARLSLVVVYLCAVFHKLNSSYFDVETSGAATMYRRLAASVPLLPVGPAFDAASIWTSLAAEAAIPILLALRRTAVAGAVVGLAFHFLLALHPPLAILSFSVTLLPLFWLCIAPGRAAAFTIGPWTRRAARAFAAAGAAAYVVAQAGRPNVAVPYVGDALRPTFDGGVLLSWTYALAVAAVFADNLRATRGAAPESGSGLRPASWAFAAFPVLALVNGASPYLGLKTESSFAMFSNLRTEVGRSNHLIVPDSVQFTDWLRDPVAIVDCSDRGLLRLRDDGFGITYFQLRVLRTREKRSFRVAFVRDGRLVEFDGSRPETRDALPAVPWIATKLCDFRPIDLRDPVRCRH